MQTSPCSQVNSQQVGNSYRFRGFRFYKTSEKSIILWNFQCLWQHFVNIRPWAEGGIRGSLASQEAEQDLPSAYLGQFTVTFPTELALPLSSLQTTPQKQRLLSMWKKKNVVEAIFRLRLPPFFCFELNLDIFGFVIFLWCCGPTQWCSVLIPGSEIWGHSWQSFRRYLMWCQGSNRGGVQASQAPYPHAISLDPKFFLASNFTVNFFITG